MPSPTEYHCLSHWKAKFLPLVSTHEPPKCTPWGPNDQISWSYPDGGQIGDGMVLTCFEHVAEAFLQWVWERKLISIYLRVYVVESRMMQSRMHHPFGLDLWYFTFQNLPARMDNAVIFVAKYVYYTHLGVGKVATSPLFFGHDFKMLNSWILKIGWFSHMRQSSKRKICLLTFVDSSSSLPLYLPTFTWPLHLPLNYLIFTFIPAPWLASGNGCGVPLVQFPWKPRNLMAQRPRWCCFGCCWRVWHCWGSCTSSRRVAAAWRICLTQKRGWEIIDVYDFCLTILSFYAYM